MRRKKRKEKNKIFVVIPAYNEGLRVDEVIKGVKKFTQNIIVVDDGSSDKTSEVAKKTGAMVFRHKINLGQGAARMTGCEAAWKLGAETIITLDSDGQHNPVHLPKFIKKLNAGYEIVLGQRDFRSGAPLVRRLGNKLGSILIRIFFGINIPDLGCGFRAFTKSAYNKVKWDSLVRYGSETEMVARIGKNKLKYTLVPIETIYIDKYKGMTILDTIGILFNIPRWLIS